MTNRIFALTLVGIFFWFTPATAVKTIKASCALHKPWATRKSVSKPNADAKSRLHQYMSRKNGWSRYLSWRSEEGWCSEVVLTAQPPLDITTFSSSPQPGRWEAEHAAAAAALVHFESDVAALEDRQQRRQWEICQECFSPRYVHARNRWCTRGSRCGEPDEPDSTAIVPIGSPYTPSTGSSSSSAVAAACQFSEGLSSTASSSSSYARPLFRDILATLPPLTAELRIDLAIEYVEYAIGRLGGLYDMDADARATAIRRLLREFHPDKAVGYEEIFVYIESLWESIHT